MLMQSAKNEWQENLSLIVLSKLVLYIHISSFRVRFYEKKSKMTCVRVSSPLSSSNVHKSRARGFKGCPTMRCFVIMAYLITPLRSERAAKHNIVTNWAKTPSHVAALSAAPRPPAASEKVTAKRTERVLTFAFQSVIAAPLDPAATQSYNHDRTYAYQKGVE